MSGSRKRALKQDWAFILLLAGIFVLMLLPILAGVGCHGKVDIPDIVITFPSPKASPSAIPSAAPSPIEPTCPPGQNYVVQPDGTGHCEGPKPDASPSPLCPPGTHLHYFSEDPPAAMCVPDATPSPSPCPLGQHRVVLERFPAGETCVPDQPPSSPSPGASCDVPQLTSDSWELINWGCKAGGPCPNPKAADELKPGETLTPVVDAAAARRFANTRDALVALVEREITDITGCARGEPCSLTSIATAQQFHARLASRLRGRGYCAGQHEDGRSDSIEVSTNPPQEGLWLEVHEVCGPPEREIACWGKVGKANSLWRIKGTGTPAPSPAPDPSPAPSPSPTAAPSVPPAPKPGISTSATKLSIGGTAVITCDTHGLQMGDFNVAADRPPTRVSFCMGLGADFTFEHNRGNPSARVRILNGGPNTPLGRWGSCALNIDCHADEYAGGPSSSVRIEVKK